MTKTLLATAAAVLILLPCSSNQSQARGHHYRHHYHHNRLIQTDKLPHVADANGNVVSKKTGARATVGTAYAAKFQAYVDDLEAAGATVLFMGGIRRGHCWSGGMHPCGKALDVCQRSRGVVDQRCKLPGREAIAKIAAAHGLFEGGQWCNSDYGHAQAGVSAPACGQRSTMMARSHIHRTHYAQRRTHTRVAYYTQPPVYQYPQYQY